MRPAGGRSLLLAVIVLSTCIGLFVGSLAAWAIYARFGPVERVVTQPITVSGSGGGGQSVGAIAQQASASVVEIATKPVSAAALLAGDASLVTGFAVSSDGLVLTSIHAIRGATSLQVGTPDGHSYPASIVRADAAHGIALLRATGAQNLTPLSFASDTPRPGDLSIAVAHAPFFPLVLSTGVVSATGRTITLTDGEPSLTDVLTVDATPDRREDGAPLLSGSGTVIGVVVDAQGVEPGVVALSAKAASDLVQQVTGAGSSQPTLGIDSAVVEPGAAALASMPPGALVTALTPGGPAAQAGVHAGDVVTAVDGQGIDASHPLDATGLGLTADQQVTLTVWRAGTTLSIPLTVGSTTAAGG